MSDLDFLWEDDSWWAPDYDDDDVWGIPIPPTTVDIGGELEETDLEA